MTLIQLKPLNCEAKSNSLKELNNSTLSSIFGGCRLPNGNELALVIADPNTNWTRDMVGAILDCKEVNINIAIFDEGSTNNDVGQFNL